MMGYAKDYLSTDMTGTLSNGPFPETHTPDNHTNLLEMPRQCAGTPHAPFTLASRIVVCVSALSDCGLSVPTNQDGNGEHEES
jgi:hypothetical protein